MIFIDVCNQLYFSFQLLIDNIGRPAPNVTHLLLKFDIDHAVEQTVLQPKFHYRFFWFQVAYVHWYLILWRLYDRLYFII